MLVVIVVVITLIVLVARGLIRPPPTETKRVEVYSRVPWTAKEIDVPVKPKPPTTNL